MTRGSKRFDWPTLAVLIGAYALWLAGLTALTDVWIPLGMVAVAVAVALHASVTHEVLHGHPFRNRHLNAALVFPSLNLVIPYIRFRDTHLAHHRDSALTDPYDDPESNYFDSADWHRLTPVCRVMLRVNNTLAGRMLIGPMVGQIRFMVGDWRLIRQGDGRVALAWAWHVPAVALVVLAYASWAQMPVWAFAMATYGGHSIVKIRTFLEHRAHDTARARTVVVEDRGLLAFLFLNNNLHIVHHMHPGVAWYDLPALYRSRRDQYLTENQGYTYRSYGEIFVRYFWRAKDPVPHPLWSRQD